MKRLLHTTESHRGCRINLNSCWKAKLYRCICGVWTWRIVNEGIHTSCLNMMLQGPMCKIEWHLVMYMQTDCGCNWTLPPPPSPVSPSHRPLWWRENMTSPSLDLWATVATWRFNMADLLEKNRSVCRYIERHKHTFYVFCQPVVSNITKKPVKVHLINTADLKGEGQSGRSPLQHLKGGQCHTTCS